MGHIDHMIDDANMYVRDERDGDPFSHCRGNERTGIQVSLHPRILLLSDFLFFFTWYRARTEFLWVGGSKAMVMLSKCLIPFSTFFRREREGPHS